VGKERGRLQRQRVEGKGSPSRSPWGSSSSPGAGAQAARRLGAVLLRAGLPEQRGYCITDMPG